MPSNLKRMVRARMASAGEGYQAALRWVRAQEGTPTTPAGRTYCPVIQWPEGLRVDECSWDPPCDEHRRRADQRRDEKP